MGILNIFTNQKQNDLFNTCSFILNKSQVNFTKSGISNSLEDHIEYPSILSLKDTLTNYGIESAAIRKGEYSYSDFEPPFICSIQKEGWSKANFTIVTKAETDGVEYLDPLTNSLQQISLEEFEKIDKNIILLMETAGAKDEPNLGANRKAESAGKISKRVPIYLTTFALIASITFSLSASFGIQSGIGIAYIITSFLGFIASGLLLWHEVDAHNPFIKEVCGGNAKKHPMNGELKQQTEKIHTMRDWCNDIKIRAKTTIYINGRELPDNYNIADLKNFF